MQQFKIVAFIVCLSVLGFCYGNAQSAEQAKPTIEQQSRQLDQEDARAAIVISYLQGQIDGLKEYRIRIKDARGALGKAAKKDKAPIKASVKHSGS
jgi:hypothetical protein